MDEDWNIVEVLLDFAELNGSHSGENMATSVYKTLEELNLVDKVCPITN